MNQTRLPGYMAITVAIMVSIVMVLLGVALSTLSLFGQTNGVTETLKQKSAYAARGCMERALLTLSLNNAYTGNETITLQADGETLTCNIGPITTQGPNKVIKTQATVRDLTTNISETVDGASLSTVSIQETQT